MNPETQKVDVLSDADKLAIALEAIEIADGVMSYCGGDAWEREATANDRDRFADLYTKLFPPEPMQQLGSYPWSRYHNPPKPKVKCPECGYGCRGDIGVRDHLKAKHPESLARVGGAA